jgi:hypothetical protein
MNQPGVGSEERGLVREKASEGTAWAARAQGGACEDGGVEETREKGARSLGTFWSLFLVPLWVYFSRGHVAWLTT